MDTKDDNINQNDVQYEFERSYQHFQYCSKQLEEIKKQLNEIHRYNQSDQYIEILNEFDKTIQSLVDVYQHIEQLNLQINKNEHFKMDLQLQLLRDEIDRELFELHRLREEAVNEENNFSINELTTDNNNTEEDDTSNVLRQRRTIRKPLDPSYDTLEQDLISLRQKIDDIDKLVIDQQQKLSKIELYRTIIHNRIHSASSVVSTIAHNRYLTTATGAVLGASVAGPVGFLMGTKIGGLVTVSGSALGALWMNIMRQRVIETDQPQNNDTPAYNQAML